MEGMCPPPPISAISSVFCHYKHKEALVLLKYFFRLGRLIVLSKWTRVGGNRTDRCVVRSLGRNLGTEARCATGRRGVRWREGGREGTWGRWEGLDHTPQPRRIGDAARPFELFIYRFIIKFQETGSLGPGSETSPGDLLRRRATRVSSRGSRNTASIVSPPWRLGLE